MSIIRRASKSSRNKPSLLPCLSNQQADESTFLTSTSATQAKALESLPMPKLVRTTMDDASSTDLKFSKPLLSSTTLSEKGSNHQFTFKPSTASTYIDENRTQSPSQKRRRISQLPYERPRVKVCPLQKVE